MAEEFIAPLDFFRRLCCCVRPAPFDPEDAAFEPSVRVLRCILKSPQAASSQQRTNNNNNNN
eukprot:CAMPEP_0202464114 /NCGR_PEP_ID=MMETSP1360-20130828/60855_1 /ASSEMBLY_ACC=CAM_ASM_000848 /TAXON_ID=515479 /ORGANISM="Licmophora paradoxa, Strain CCMP2313" /LENGTH=61 /DNA_ID=CAMNT_0049087287 /DNA_START=56 /DNA_END=238 /DNA_ORIENTATION=-